MNNQETVELFKKLGWGDTDIEELKCIDYDFASIIEAYEIGKKVEPKYVYVLAEVSEFGGEQILEIFVNESEAKKERDKRVRYDYNVYKWRVR